ncbi:uncharacterized protein EDB91DRAFT_1086780 [Suillus paluster]|uniref:uncharacterized protein n=1 Tax=Suillus paluster TaxID=48578 RepID=UPI001B87FB09|nr:uncharacterized protein EDB91DRAFT_1086780 [Suillus paluster]KAG1726423.1 hypothetical protein EDB91DRAFT_1086780 [Suillus paluster]
MSHNTHPCANGIPSQPSWVNNMMAHIKPDRVSEFSTSGTGDDVSPLSGQNLKFPTPVLAALLDRISKNQRSAAMQNDERKDSDSERKKAKADRVGGLEVIRTQATCNTRKRKLDNVNIDSNNNSNENISPHCVPKQLSPPGAPTTKCICCEKTGTEWQSVLDVIKHGEEIRSKQNNAIIEEMKACTAVLERTSERYLEAVTHTTQ